MGNSVPSEINVGKPFFIAQAPGINEERSGCPLIGSDDRRTAGNILLDVLTK